MGTCKVARTRLGSTNRQWWNVKRDVRNIETPSPYAFWLRASFSLLTQPLSMVIDPLELDKAASSSTRSTRRIMSVDALRGFDMFWIVGAESIVQALHKISPSGLINLVALQLTHRDWEGLRFYDLIFPLFVFLVGVSLVFSLSKIQRKEGKLATCRRILTRSALLYLFGVFYYGGFAQGAQDIRLLGVLQRIALCYLVAGLLYCFLKIRGLVLTCASLLRYGDAPAPPGGYRALPVEEFRDAQARLRQAVTWAQTWQQTHTGDDARKARNRQALRPHADRT